MKRVSQFVGEPPARGLIDEGLNGGDQRAMTREPDRIMGPQAGIVEAGGLTEGIVTAAMSIAGQVVERPEFAKDGETGRGAEGLLEFGKGRDFVAQQVLAEDLGVEGEGPPNVIVPTCLTFQSEL